MSEPKSPPILAQKHYDETSAFAPANLLREARRQKQLADRPVPEVRVLDPDGDIVRQAKAAGRAIRDSHWACCHTKLYRMNHDGLELGIVPCAVGASFAALIAEQLFASGCGLLISVTSSGQLVELRPPPYFVLIEQALRDEGTSYHNNPHSIAPPGPVRAPDPRLRALALLRRRRSVCLAAVALAASEKPTQKRSRSDADHQKTCAFYAPEFD